MRSEHFQHIEPRAFWALLAVGGAVTLAGLGAAHTMEVHGHAITGMTNQVVWGLPHVFAIFMIVAASGVLNVASIGSVFGQSAYKPRAPLSGLLSLALLAGGLMVLMLDLGRPDRVIVAATHYNFTSVFAWNVFLYSGMAAIVGVYLWTMFERRMNRYSKAAGIAALVWRFALTTGTGSIFAFLVARQAYQSAVLAPLFIVLSFAWGLAVFLIVQSAMYAWNGQALPEAVRARMARLLGVFVAAALYLVAVYHLTNLYFARQGDFEAFILFGRGDPSGVFPALFWGGYVLLGALLPMALLFHPRGVGPNAMLTASAMVVAGAFALLFVFIVGGQSFPLEIFPGHEVTSSFADGQVELYVPRWPEWLLGIGGLGAAFVLTLIGVRALDVLPHDELKP
ncbi:MAG: NrfD/PsrC family molybdoenzyme membrane anchor subunit [Piscinibacter sp.]|uniref:NrfD/PsrC family molybdoenzyme membrane anchor subunit n=1 Tax=Piscinibacter sp. TaxID=1903157 RepID=UPI003D0DACD0